MPTESKGRGVNSYFASQLKPTILKTKKIKTATMNPN